MNLVQLSREQHGGLRIDPAKAAAVAATVHMVPLVRSELRRLASQYPLFLAKNGDTGEFYLAALMGLEPHENLYWNGSALDAAHVPLNLLRQPFYIGGDDAASGVICIDMDSPAVDPAGSRGLLESDGRDSAYIGQVQAMLGELASQQAPTRAFIDQTVAMQLVTEIKLDITFDNGTGTSLAGLYGIDERALARQAGGIADFDVTMDLAAMVLSLEHVAGLVRRKNARIAAEKAWFDAAA